ncbi:MAG: folylpolyglutamate synthase/dihydrofolate synthase family protein [Bacteroidota bacterium]
MNYQETVQFLFSQLPVYQRDGAPAYKNNLNNTIVLDKHFNHPHTKFKTIHVAGTNGKGSVSHMIASVLQTCGYKTGLYTSPHLKDYRERIKVNGEMINEEFVVDFVENSMSLIERYKPSFFELTVALAFSYFEKQKVDVAVIETGMGGRLDSTNIINPVLSIITNIGEDHTQFLGNSLQKIAVEKAGIIKKGVPVVIGKSQTETENIFRDRAKELNSDIYFADQIYKEISLDSNSEEYQSFDIFRNKKILYKNLEIDLKGNYQKENILTCIAVFDIINDNDFAINEICLRKGLQKVQISTGLSGRWQILQSKPLVIADTAHNVDGLTIVIEQLLSLKYRKLIIIFGMVNDKNAEEILKLLPAEADYIFTKANIPRAMDEKILFKQAKDFGLNGLTFPSVEESYSYALKMASDQDLIFIGGSTFIVAEVVT